MPRCSGGTQRCGDEISVPSTQMLPPLSSMKPAIMRKVVVLPQPDGPSKVTSSPRSSCRLTSLTTATLP